MQPETLDHVALWVADRDRIADFVTDRVGMHIVDRTDAFTLVGSDARRGKLTLFSAEGPREQGAFAHVALRVNDLDAALERLPEELPLERPRPGEAYFDLGEGLRVGLVDSADDHIDEARETGIEIDNVVDAANTYAVFLWGPERVRVEYVEHKPTFSLT